MKHTNHLQKLLYAAMIITVLILFILQFDGQERIVGSLKIGCEKPGVQVLLIRKKPSIGEILSPPHSSFRAGGYCRVVSGQRSFTLDGLNMLTGLVDIKTPESALRYARLETWPIVFVGDRRFEIIARSAARDMPDYIPDPHFPHEDFEGVISDKDYVQGGFTPPVIKQEGDHFIIYRWEYSHRGFADYSKEIVGHDGSYQYSIIKEKESPYVPSMLDLQ